LISHAAELSHPAVAIILSLTFSIFSCM
jgi:hypothetical protein